MITKTHIVTKNITKKKKKLNPMRQTIQKRHNPAGLI